MAPEEVLEELPLEYFDGGFAMLSRMLAEDSVVHRGIYSGVSNMGLRCYTMIGALQPPEERLRRLAADGGLSLEGMASFLGVDDGGIS
jgi:hypothetical protein